MHCIYLMNLKKADLLDVKFIRANPTIPFFIDVAQIKVFSLRDGD